MPHRIGFILAATVLFAVSVLPRASIQQPQSGSAGYRLKVDVNSVLLNVSVRDRLKGHGIPNLRKQDFLVYEDGNLQQVDQLLARDAPFSSLLLIDNSGSTRSLLALMKQAAIEFTRQLNPNDKVAIATFNSLVELVQDFTDDRALASRAIGSISSIGGTALYDALMTCIDTYMRGITERSAIVVFTDGVDNQLEGQNTEGSRTPFSQLYRRIQEIDPIIYTIFLDTELEASAGRARSVPGLDPGIGWPFPRPRSRPAPAQTRSSDRKIHDKGRDQLATIADQTGGRMYPLTRAEQLAWVYNEIAEDLRIQYLLAYTPSGHARDGMWHDVQVRVKDRPDVAVRTRKGYYAQKTQGSR